MGVASQLQHIVGSAAPIHCVTLCVDNVAVVRYKALVAAFQLAHVLVNILAFHRNGTGHGFGLGSRVPLGGVLLSGLFAGGTAGGDQAGGAALPLGAVCGAGGGCAFAAAALCFGSCAAGRGAAFCTIGFGGGSGCRCAFGCGAGCRCAFGCGAGDRIGTALGGGCIRFAGCRNGLTLRRGTGLFVDSGRAAGKEQRQCQHQQCNAFSCSLQNKKSLAVGRGQKRAQLYRRCLHIFPLSPKVCLRSKACGGCPDLRYTHSAPSRLRNGLCRAKLDHGNGGCDGVAPCFRFDPFREPRLFCFFTV